MNAVGYATSDVDVEFDVFRDPTRRRLLLALLDHTPRPDEKLCATDGGDDDEVSRIQSRLYHIHLPKLEAAGLIEWDRETGEIHRGPNFDEVQDVLEVLQEYERELPRSGSETHE